MKNYLLIFTIISIGIFSACEKNSYDKNLHDKPYSFFNFNDSLMTYENYVDTLETMYGISFESLSNIDEVSIFVNRKTKTLQRLLNSFNSKSYNDLNTTKIKNLASMVQFYYNNGNDDLTWIYLDSLCTSCQAMDNFMIDEGLDECYIPSSDIYINIPNGQMQNDITSIGLIRDAIIQRHSFIEELSIEEQNALITATIFYNLKKDLAKQLSLSCEQIARSKFIANVTAATIAYTVAAAACTGTNVAVLLCEGWAFSIYISEIATQKELLDYRLQECARN